VPIREGIAVSTEHRLVRFLGPELAASAAYVVTMCGLALATGSVTAAVLTLLIAPAVLKGWSQLAGAASRRSVHLLAMFATVGVIAGLWIGLGDVIEDLPSTLNATTTALVFGVLGVIAVIAWPLAILVYVAVMLGEDAQQVGPWYHPFTVFVSIGVIFWSVVIVRAITGT
jgi:hypothetical protein